MAWFSRAKNGLVWLVVDGCSQVSGGHHTPLAWFPKDVSVGRFSGAWLGQGSVYSRVTSQCVRARAEKDDGGAPATTTPARSSASTRSPPARSSSWPAPAISLRSAPPARELGRGRSAWVEPELRSIPFPAAGKQANPIPSPTDPLSQDLGEERLCSCGSGDVRQSSSRSHGDGGVCEGRRPSWSWMPEKDTHLWCLAKEIEPTLTQTITCGMCQVENFNPNSPISLQEIQPI